MKLFQNLQLCVGAFEDPATAMHIQKAGRTFMSCIDSLSEFLEEPVREKFESVKGQIATMLAKVDSGLNPDTVLKEIRDAVATAKPQSRHQWGLC